MLRGQRDQLRRHLRQSADRHNHCGGCSACAAGTLCSLGMCCTSGQNNCSGVCKDLKADSANCGMCGNACAAGNACSVGKCCPTGQTNCNGACVDLQTDTNNCNACGTVCNTPPDKCKLATGATCAAGACVYPAEACNVIDCYSTPTCDTSSGDCVATPLNGGTCGGTGCYVGNASGTCASASASTPPATRCRRSTARRQRPVPHRYVRRQRPVHDDGLAERHDLRRHRCVPVNGTCMAGVCTGTPKCTAQDACHSAVCDSTSGACSQKLVPKGTSCQQSNDCLQNAACDDSVAASARSCPTRRPARRPHPIAAASASARPACAAAAATT